MNTPATTVDRKKVEAFFTWSDPKWWLYGGAAACAFVGLVSISNGAYLFGLLLLAGAVFLGHRGRSSDNPLEIYYKEVVKAKRLDLSRMLLRAYRKTETDVDSLLDFDPSDLVTLDPTAVDTDQKTLFEKLIRKSVFLFGHGQAKSGAAAAPTDIVRAAATAALGKPLVDAIQGATSVGLPGRSYRRPVLIEQPQGQRYVDVEFTPIRVSILFLAKTELIVYFADVDITRGDLMTEEVGRVFLKDVVEIRSGSSTSRVSRAEHSTVFREIERMLKRKLPNEIVEQDYSIIISKTDGGKMSLPVGAPSYQIGDKGVLDSNDQEDNRYIRVAREIFRRINDAKARI